VEGGIAGDREEGEEGGEEGGVVRGDRGSSMVSWGLTGLIPSLCLSSVFSSCREALSSWSFVLNS